jgi:hypothetical protein
MKIRDLVPAAVFVAALTLATVSVASASGTARFQQSDGTVKTFPVNIAFIHTSVRISAIDGHDVLTIPNAACTFAGDLERCLPYNIILHRNGTEHDIPFEHGTVYLNLTGTMQPLTHSSKQVPPNGLLLVVRTQRGTYITVNGTLDEVKQ